MAKRRSIYKKGSSPKNISFAQYTESRQSKRESIVLSKKKVTMKVGTHILYTEPVRNIESLISIENTLSISLQRKSPALIAFGKVLKKAGYSSLNHLANELME